MTTFKYSRECVTIEEGQSTYQYSAEEISEYYNKSYLECTDVEVSDFWVKQAFGWNDAGMPMWVPRKVKYLLGVEQTKVYDLGYTNLTQDQYFQQLKEWNIDYLIDVRWVGRGKKGFNSSELEQRCREEGIAYVRARELGNPYYKDKDWIEFWKSGKRYYAYADKIYKVARLLKDYDMCLLCVEENTDDCHRQFIIQDLKKLACVKRFFDTS